MLRPRFGVNLLYRWGRPTVVCHSWSAFPLVRGRDFSLLSKIKDLFSKPEVEVQTPEKALKEQKKKVNRMIDESTKQLGLGWFGRFIAGTMLKKLASLEMKVAQQANEIIGSFSQKPEVRKVFGNRIEVVGSSTQEWEQKGSGDTRNGFELTLLIVGENGTSGTCILTTHADASHRTTIQDLKVYDDRQRLIYSSNSWKGSNQSGQTEKVHPTRIIDVEARERK